MYTIDYREAGQVDWSSDVAGYGMPKTALEAAVLLKDLRAEMPTCEFRVGCIEMDTGLFTDATFQVENILAGYDFAQMQSELGAV